MSKDTITVNINIHDIPIVVEELEKAQKEIERLNNIINELEKWVDEYPSEDVWYKDIINKLKELKEE